jgi:hypothetical protein
MQSKSYRQGFNRAAKAMIENRPLTTEINAAMADLMNTIPAAPGVEVSTIKRGADLEVEEVRKEFRHPAADALAEIAGMFGALLTALERAKEKGVSFANKSVR